MSTLPTTNAEIDLDVHRAIEARRTSFNQSQNDILREVFKLPALTLETHKKDPTELESLSSNRTRRAVKTRRTGSYEFALLGKRFQEASLQLAYKRCLLELSKLDSKFLERLSEKRTRSRRLVARDPRSLFFKTPQLAEKFAAPLEGPWWFDINLSQPQVRNRLQTACEVAGLQFGVDLELEFPD